MSEDANFLSRWSRRKALARQGQVPAEPPAPAPSVTPAADVATATRSPALLSPEQEWPDAAPAVPSGELPAQMEPGAHPEPAPTLEDVARLPADTSDYSRFVARNVQPDVKNAALKKLFSDPHFNVMDGLDIYIDDYSRPDPLPDSMLRQLAQSQFLGLFTEPPAAASSSSPDTPAALPLCPSPASGEEGTEPHPDSAPTSPDLAPSPLEPSPHEDADLRLQPDPCTGPRGLAASPGSGAGG